jgi:thioredoxin 1
MNATAFLNEATFAATVLDSATPVLVDFTAEWCPPCKHLAPVLEELSAEYGPALRFVAVDTDAEPDLSAQYGVQGMPTLVIFRGGKEIHRSIGFMPKTKLKSQIDRALGLG